MVGEDVVEEPRGDVIIGTRIAGTRLDPDPDGERLRWSHPLAPPLSYLFR